MRGVHIQLQRQSIILINTYLGHCGQMFIWQEVTMFSVKLEIKKLIFLKWHCSPATQIKASYHSFGRYSVARETTACFMLENIYNFQPA